VVLQTFAVPTSATFGIGYGRSFGAITSDPIYLFSSPQ
jgi:hypothetical protein